MEFSIVMLMFVKEVCEDGGKQHMGAPCILLPVEEGQPCSNCQNFLQCTMDRPSYNGIMSQKA